MMVDIGDIKHALGTALKAADKAAQDYNQLLDDNLKQTYEISELKTEVGRLEALLADKKPESECECECCKHRDEALVDAIADAVGVKPDKIRKITICPFNSPNENTERAPKEDPCCDEESEPTLKDLYELGKYLVDTIDEIESIHIQVVRTRKKEDDDEE